MTLEEAFARFKRDADGQAFDRLFHRVKGKCIATLMRRGCSPNDVDDALQEIRLNILQKRHEIENVDHFDGLACLYARGAVNQIRRWTKLHVELDLVEQDPEDPAKSQLAGIEGGQEADYLLRPCMERLSERYRIVMLLVYWEELTTEEAAEVMQESASVVKNLRDNGLRRLRECVERRRLSAGLRGVGGTGR